MDKRAIIAAVLSMAVLLGYQIFFINPRMEARRVEQEKARKLAAEQASERTLEDTEKSVKAETPPTAPRPFQAPETPKSTVAKDIIVDTGVARITITTLGAGLKELTLLKYRDPKGKRLNLVSTGKASKGESAKGRRLGQKMRWRPLYLDGGALGNQANSGVYTANRESLTLTPENPEGTLELTYRSPSGIAIGKSLRFEHGSYVFDVDLRWRGGSDSGDISVVWGPGITTEGREDDYYATTGPVTYRSGKLVFADEDELEEGKAVVQQGDIRWTSLHSKYFMAALIPRSAFDGAVVRDDGGVLVGLRYRGGASGEGRLSLFAGPKDERLLKSYGSSLNEAIDLGFFGFLAKPLLVGLRFFHGLTGSYGLSIIIVTFVIKILFYPLTQKSMKSMQAMQRLQPKMKQVREIFKDDRQRMNEEVMKLYRENKANPLGGCLPMLLQIPVFFALYNALLGSIDLRQTPFLWMHDLSAPETGLFVIPGIGIDFRILVLLMGASMFLQQKMTPAAGDPTQQKMMLFMPIFFTFLFWSFPAGLVVYWFTNNVLSIIQQYFTLRGVGKPKAAVVEDVAAPEELPAPKPSAKKAASKAKGKSSKRPKAGKKS